MNVSEFALKSERRSSEIISGPSLLKILPKISLPVAIAILVLLIGVIMSSKYLRFLKNSFARDGTKIVFTGGELKQVYIVRTDLDMGKGKIAAQCCHAAVKAYRDISSMDGSAKEALEQWEWQGSRKVVVKISSEDELRNVILSAKKKGLYATTIRDAGKTQIPSGSMTVGVIGPANEKEIDQVSGHLKLL